MGRPQCKDHSWCYRRLQEGSDSWRATVQAETQLQNDSTGEERCSSAEDFSLQSVGEYFIIVYHYRVYYFYNAPFNIS